MLTAATGVDGLELARRLRAVPQGATIHLVAISGYGQPLDRARARAAGFGAHLVKPVDPVKLRAVLAEFGTGPTWELLRKGYPPGLAAAGSSRASAGVAALSALRAVDGSRPVPPAAQS